MTRRDATRSRHLLFHREAVVAVAGLVADVPRRIITKALTCLIG